MWRPPNKCTCRWSTVCPPSSPVLITRRYPLLNPASRAMCAAFATRCPSSAAWVSSACTVEAICSFGITNTCVGACGLMSAKAMLRSSSYTRFAGIDPATILQKRHSAPMAVPHSAFYGADIGIPYASACEIFRLFARRPGVIRSRKRSAIPDRGMRVEPPLEDGMRRRIVERVLPEDVERPLPHCLRIRDDSVHRLLSVDIGIVFKSPAIGVRDGRAKHGNHAERQRKHPDSAPIGDGPNPPFRSITRDQQARAKVAQPEERQQRKTRQRSAKHHMAQRVVSQLVREDERDLLWRRMRDRRVPHHYALGRAEPGHICVQLGPLRARLHHEHSLRRNRHAAACHHLFQLRYQSRVCLLHRRKAVEQRVDHVRRNKYARDHNPHRHAPKPYPPALAGAANDPHQDHNDR